jgi:2-amino-4-hydroxy-6-hydroxymethyldihydropteridine diphosphokinase
MGLAMNELTPVLIAIGSNIDREQKLPQALAALKGQPELSLRAVSPIYESLPVGARVEQPLFFNAAALIETRLGPVNLKAMLLTIEANLGRVRNGDKYAPRPIDLDIALYGQQILELHGRHIPDPDILSLPHLALPLADVAPDWTHPELGLTLQEIAKRLNFSAKEIKQL